MLLPLSGTEEGRRSIYIRFSGAKEAGEISQTMAGEVVTYIGLQLPDSSPAPKRAGEVFIYTVGEVFIHFSGFSGAGEAEVFIYTVKNTTKFTGNPEIFDPQKSFPGCVLLRYLRMN